jgi:hypothetical protein
VFITIYFSKQQIIGTRFGRVVERKLKSCLDLNLQQKQNSQNITSISNVTGVVIFLL